MQRLTYAAVVSLVRSTPAAALLLDVREPNECAEGMIPTASNVPLTVLPEALKESPEAFKAAYGFSKPKEDDPIVVYCQRGGRAERGAAILVNGGFTNVNLYPGSWTEWSANQNNNQNE